MKHSMPFLAGLKRYLAQKVYPFHTPGHKGGRGILPAFASLLEHALAIDVSLMNELDDLHGPQNILAEAQAQAAKLYGADKSFFCVNGTSGALHAMILGAVRQGEKILLPRNAHRSIAGALVVSGAQPVYVQPEFDAGFGIATQVTVQAIAKQFALHKDIKAVLVTSPSYYGIATDLEQIAQIVHAHEAILLVDEAHGPHLGFSDLLPKSALQSGADACAQSTHKIVGALTQCSLLHVKNGRLDAEKIRHAFSLLTTTSPNQLFLASLDAACFQLAGSGKEMAERAVELASYMREQLAFIDKIQIMDWPEKHFFDRTKVTLNVKKLGLTGYEAADFLRGQMIAVELADAENILFLITYADEKAGIDKAVAAIKKLPAREKVSREKIPGLPEPQAVMTPREAFFGKTIKKPILEAKDCIAAEEITFYPPGIPVVLPGELITQEVLAYCKTYADTREKFEEKIINVVQ